MIKFKVPGLGDYNLEHLVTDVNGTLAVDGQLIAKETPLESDLVPMIFADSSTAETRQPMACPGDDSQRSQSC
jgi:hypothetical protein